MAKATVQAALGPVILRKLQHNPEATEEQKHYGEIILMVCVLSIVLTAPIGAILISITGPRLLTKTKQAPPSEGKLFYWPINVHFSLPLFSISLKYKIKNIYLILFCHGLPIT